MKPISNILLGLFLFNFVVTAQAAIPKKIPSNCTTAREFITSLEFMRDKKQFILAEAEAQKMALEVSAGCNDAASRFIKITMLLMESGMAWKPALETGLLFAKRTNEETHNFISIFSKAYAEEGLDLDLNASFKLAHSLSDQYQGNHPQAKEDFDRMLIFCMKTTELGLPKPQCGDYAARLARIGERWNGGISKPFLTAFDYLRSEKGPALITADALKVAEKLTENGPGASENFIQAYRYAISAKGLNASRQDAIHFATKLAERKLQKLPPEESEEKGK